MNTLYYLRPAENSQQCCIVWFYSILISIGHPCCLPWSPAFDSFWNPLVQLNFINASILSMLQCLIKMLFLWSPVSLHLTLPWLRIAQVWKMIVSPQVLEVRVGFWFLVSYKEQSSKAKKLSLGSSQTFFRWACGKNLPACCAPLFYPVEAGKWKQTKRKRSVGILYHSFLLLLNYSMKGVWESVTRHFQSSWYTAGIRGSKQLFLNFHF